MNAWVHIGRYGGARLLPAENQALSRRAQALGLNSLADAESLYCEQIRDRNHGDGTGWSLGSDYHCPVCDREFVSVSGARKHRQHTLHPVLRMDLTLVRVPA